MTQVYSDPTRESDPHALPDIEVFYVTTEEAWQMSKTLENAPYDSGGWYWWSCTPGCLPDSDPIGPFNTEAEAIANAQDY